MSSASFTFLIFCFGFLQFTTALPDITPCQRNDKVCFINLVNDMYQAVIQGDPDLSLNSLDPLPQDLVQGDLSIIKYTLTNSTCTGYRKCKILDAEFSRRHKRLHLKLQCPEFRMYGDYEIDGNLIGVPIQGKGPYWIECRDYFIKFDAETDLTRSDDDKTYISIKNFNIKADLRGGMDFDLVNLFNGQKELADRVLQFARNNWKPVSDLLQGPTFSANIKKLVQNFNKFMKHVPLENVIRQ